MKRRYPAIRSTVGVSLFPFLAVLVCTMGALIVLLVLVLQLAKVDAADSEPLVGEPSPADVRRMEREDFEWQSAQLEQQCQEAKESVEENRLVLSHLEQHIRELEQRWKQLKNEAADLQARVQGGGQDQAVMQAELAKLQDRIAATKQELEAAKSRAASRPPAYAIVPYVGPNGTHRRPVFLECDARGVTIQPEGIVIPPDYFEGPLGAGNPLDAALRAIREYYVRAGLSAGEPYPLLVVRPDGVETYALGRAAMRHWDDEFGYELIDASMEVKYPDADPQLAEFLRKVVADACSRQRILAAAMPSQTSPRSEAGFVASSVQGGFVPVGGSSHAGSRTGGFGRGGDSRYADGQAAGPVAGRVPPSAQEAVGGPTGRGPAAGGPGPSGAARGAASVAKARGEDWALPNRAPGATGIERPIRLACLRDRLIILPERDVARSPEVVLVDGDMLDEVDTLVSKIWSQIEDWGIAVAGGYWKPVLRVDVAQGADERFEELRVLLEGSGLVVQRSSR